MKKYSKYIGKLSLAILVFLSGCNKDYLDKNPLDRISGQTIWRNEADVKLVLTGVYSQLQSGFYAYWKVWLDTYSDNAYDRFGYFGFDNLTQGIVNPTNVNGTFYNTPYNGIASCNYFLENIDKVPLSDAVKNSYKAEVRFLRGMFYFDLVQAFGGVPLYRTAPQTVDEAKVTQSSSEEVLAFVNEDIDFAISNLPDQVYNGRAVKASAQGVKAKVLLFQKKYAEAATVAKQIMDGGKFKLADSYSGLFLTASQKNNPEIIFSTRYAGPENIHEGGGGLNIRLGFWGAVGPYKNLVDEYECTDGKPITSSSKYNPDKPYENRDPRLFKTIETPANYFTLPDGSKYEHSDPVLTGFVQKKYVDVAKIPFTEQTALVTDQHIVHLRYADVLLMYAEAKNEVSGPDPSIYQALDQIRSRPDVKMPAVDQSVYNSKESLRSFIRHERRIELALEGHRYYDLKRWGIMEEKLNPITNPGGVRLKFGEKNNVLPFPQSEIDRNTNLVQNEGYK